MRHGPKWIFNVLKLQSCQRDPSWMAQDEAGLSAVTPNIIAAVGADQKIISFASISSSCQAVTRFVSFRFSIEVGLMVNVCATRTGERPKSCRDGCDRHGMMKYF
jgi:hypothetical protein